jgi:hypothetical protein
MLGSGVISERTKSALGYLGSTKRCTLRQNICELKGTGGGYTACSSDECSCAVRGSVMLDWSPSLSLLRGA